MKEIKKLYVKIHNRFDIYFSLEIVRNKNNKKTGKIIYPYINYLPFDNISIDENVFSLSEEVLECIEKLYFDKNTFALYIEDHPYPIEMGDIIHKVLPEEIYRQIINGTYKYAGIKINSTYGMALPRNKDAREMFNQGFEYFINGDYDNVINEFTGVIKLEPDYFEVYILRANAYYEKDLFSKAIKDYSKAIKLNPYYIDNYNSRGFCYFNKQQFDKAIKDYTKAIKFDPKLAVYYSNRGYSYEKLGQNDKAAKDYETAQKIKDEILSKSENLQD